MIVIGTKDKFRVWPISAPQESITVKQDLLKIYKRMREKITEYRKKLEVIVMGDLNCSMSEKIK